MKQKGKKKMMMKKKRKKKKKKKKKKISVLRLTPFPLFFLRHAGC